MNKHNDYNILALKITNFKAKNKKKLSEAFNKYRSAPTLKHKIAYTKLSVNNPLELKLARKKYDALIFEQPIDDISDRGFVVNDSNEYCHKVVADEGEFVNIISLSSKYFTQQTNILFFDAENGLGDDITFKTSDDVVDFIEDKFGLAVGIVGDSSSKKLGRYHAFCFLDEMIELDRSKLERYFNARVPDLSYKMSEGGLRLLRNKYFDFSVFSSARLSYCINNTDWEVLWSNEYSYLNETVTLEEEIEEVRQNNITNLDKVLDDMIGRGEAKDRKEAKKKLDSDTVILDADTPVYYSKHGSLFEITFEEALSGVFGHRFEFDKTKINDAPALSINVKNQTAFYFRDNKTYRLPYFTAESFFDESDDESFSLMDIIDESDDNTNFDVVENGFLNYTKIKKKLKKNEKLNGVRIQKNIIVILVNNKEKMHKIRDELKANNIKCVEYITKNIHSHINNMKKRYTNELTDKDYFDDVVNRHAFEPRVMLMTFQKWQSMFLIHNNNGSGDIQYKIVKDFFLNEIYKKRFKMYALDITPTELSIMMSDFNYNKLIYNCKVWTKEKIAKSKFFKNALHTIDEGYELIINHMNKLKLDKYEWFNLRGGDDGDDGDDMLNTYNYDEIEYRDNINIKINELIKKLEEIEICEPKKEKIYKNYSILSKKKNVDGDENLIIDPKKVKKIGEIAKMLKFMLMSNKFAYDAKSTIIYSKRAYSKHFKVKCLVGGTEYEPQYPKDIEVIHNKNDMVDLLNDKHTIIIKNFASFWVALCTNIKPKNIVFMIPPKRLFSLIEKTDHMWDEINIDIKFKKEISYLKRLYNKYIFGCKFFHLKKPSRTKKNVLARLTSPSFSCFFALN